MNGIGTSHSTDIGRQVIPHGVVGRSSVYPARVGSSKRTAAVQSLAHILWLVMESPRSCVIRGKNVANFGSIGVAYFLSGLPIRRRGSTREDCEERDA